MRDQYRQKFLKDHQYADWELTPIPGDASARRYFRLSKQDERAILMDYDPDDEPNEAARAYMRQARLAGTDMNSFAAIGTALFQRGFSAPKILAANTDQGFLLLEDLSQNQGSNVYARHIETHPNDEAALYEAAIDCLAAIYRSSFAADMTSRHGDWQVGTYDAQALMTELSLFTQWYVPDQNVSLSEQALMEWDSLWQEMLHCLKAHAPGLALRDFHAENLFWLPERAATSRVGLIDFQDALMAHPSYDLVSLLEDARRDVAPEIVDSLIARFCDKAGLEDGPEFRAAYAVMGAQRNMKILGFPVRADKLYGKPQYRALLPRVEDHVRRDILHPGCAGLKDWLKTYLPQSALVTGAT